MQLSEKLKAKGDKSHEFVLVCYDNNSNEQAGYLASGKFNFPAVKYAAKSEDKVQALVHSSKAQFLPSIFKVDRSGRILSEDQSTILKELGDLAS